jgi:1,4-dihydroxy-2-naphthoate octaprenyltransferase
MNKSPSLFSVLLGYARPAMLAAGALFYLLGAGMARYLGHPILWDRFWVGLIAVLLIQLTSYFLKAYYDLIDAASPLRRMQKDDDDLDQGVASRLPQQGVLMAGTTSMTAGAVLTVLMITMGAINLTFFFFLGIAVILSFFYAVPPLRLVYTAYGELVEAIVLANLFPALAFTLQTGELHRYLAMLTFPILAILLAVRLVLSLEKYARYLKYGYKTMMVVLGWQRGMRMHNLLVPAGYVLIALAFALGLPWSLTWPALLTLPVGLFEIIQINQIVAGLKPNWRLLNLTAVSLLGLALYLMNLALWTG